MKILSIKIKYIENSWMKSVMVGFYLWTGYVYRSFRHFDAGFWSRDNETCSTSFDQSSENRLPHWSSCKEGRIFLYIKFYLVLCCEICRSTYNVHKLCTLYICNILIEYTSVDYSSKRWETRANWAGWYKDQGTKRHVGGNIGNWYISYIGFFVMNTISDITSWRLLHSLGHVQ